MSESFKISVVIPCFNHGEFLPEALVSVTDMGRQDVELIVVDDGSTDKRTSEEMDKLARGIKAIRQENKGLAAARNAGIAASQGKYIFPLDADDRMRSGWIDSAIEILDSNPKVGVVYGDTIFFGVKMGRHYAGPFNLDLLLGCNILPASALYRRLVWEQNGGYDGTMPVQGFEDWDFWVGAAERGWEFAYLPEVFFEYRKAAESMLTRAESHKAEVEDFIAKKHGPLYRRAWLRHMREHTSIKRTSRRLAGLLLARAKRKYRTLSR